MYWKILNHDEAQYSWDANLARLGGFGVDQLFTWGEYRRKLGWTPLRLVLENQHGEIAAMVQALYRSYPGKVGLIYCGAGPAGDVRHWADSLADILVQHTGIRMAYCRIFSYLDYTDARVQILKKHNWQQCQNKRFSRRTMRLNLDQPLDTIREGLSKNWRYNLKRSTKRDLAVELWENPDPVVIRETYASMERIKGLAQTYSLQELIAMFEEMGNNITLYRCMDSEKNLLALRGFIHIGQYAWDWIQPATLEARKVYATYALQWTVLEQCHRLGVKSYDLMGADPEENPGVYNFKKGTGAQLTTYLGEWEWASNRLINWAANVAIRQSRSRGQVGKR